MALRLPQFVCYNFEVGIFATVLKVKSMSLRHISLNVFAFLLLIGVAPAFLAAQNSIQKESSWKPADRETVVASFEAWLLDAEVEATSAKLVREYLHSNESASGDLIDHVIQGLEIGDPEVARFAEILASARPEDQIQTSGLLDNKACHSFVRDHVRLLYGRWLARNELFDESLGQLKQLEVENVLDPATLLYYRGLMEHQLLKPKECIKTLKKLQENAGALPRRYTVLAKLMLADMKRLEEDSLDEISRMMGDIRRRTELNRSGTRVRGKEEDVIKKLDKLIKKLEKQQQQMQMAQAQGTNRPSSPADREQRMAGQGSGKVRSKRQTDGGQWGNLDPAERDAALAEMSKDLPPHYRSVIEEYFRKLADRTEKQE